MTFRLRYLDTDPYGRAGSTVGNFDTREHAEEVRRLSPNGAHMEVIER